MALLNLARPTTTTHSKTGPTADDAFDPGHGKAPQCRGNCKSDRRGGVACRPMGSLTRGVPNGSLPGFSTGSLHEIVARRCPLEYLIERWAERLTPFRQTVLDLWRNLMMRDGDLGKG